MSTPSSSTSPAIAALGISWCIRLRIRRKVDLPQPDGPISAVTSPAAMVSETRSSTMWSPNHAVISRASSPASGRGPSSIISSSVVKPNSPSCPGTGCDMAVAVGRSHSGCDDWGEVTGEGSHEVRQQTGHFVGYGQAEVEQHGNGDNPG